MAEGGYMDRKKKNGSLNLICFSPSPPSSFFFLSEQSEVTTDALFCCKIFDLFPHFFTAFHFLTTLSLLSRVAALDGM